jgi:hypothetical protein
MIGCCVSNCLIGTVLLCARHKGCLHYSNRIEIVSLVPILATIDLTSGDTGFVCLEAFLQLLRTSRL